ncbi:type II toxin-antitoxin system Phd/YefM family antitoxin [Nocardia testacea]|uniref:type II toxin-antitoxin system Phd/YefM family antitoxin n=1 Tax=Nocardia testacea TaxID=248551 RepID=UPI0033C71825
MNDRLSIRRVRAQLPTVVDAAAREGHVTVITRGGRPAAAIVPLFMPAQLEEWEDEQLEHMAGDPIPRGGPLRLPVAPTLPSNDPDRRGGVDVEASTGRPGVR